MEEVKNAQELLEETLNIMRERKIAASAKADVDKRVLKETSGDKANWKLLAKVFANKGKAWLGNNPLELDKTVKHKDFISGTFIRLLEVITAAEEFSQTENVLQEYFDAMEACGVKITVNSEKFGHADVDGLEDDLENDLKDIKAYSNTIESYSDEIKNEHTVKAEELNFAPKTGYMKAVSIYKKAASGKEVDDEVQNIHTYNQFIDTAINLAADYGKSQDSSDN